MMSEVVGVINPSVAVESGFQSIEVCLTRIPNHAKVSEFKVVMIDDLINLSMYHVLGYVAL